MTEKEIIIKKIDTIINFILEEGLQNVSKYSEIHYQKLILIFEKVKKSYLEFMPYVPGVLEEKSYENLSKSYQEMLELTKEAITIFLHKNVSKENGKISLKNIPLQNHPYTGCRGDFS